MYSELASKTNSPLLIRKTLTTDIELKDYISITLIKFVLNTPKGLFKLNVNVSALTFFYAVNLTNDFVIYKPKILVNLLNKYLFDKLVLIKPLFNTFVRMSAIYEQ